MLTRRDFNGGLASLAFGGLALAGCSGLNVENIPDYIRRIPNYRDRMMRRVAGFGSLVQDDQGLLDLPEGFSYEIVSPAGPGPKGHGGGPLKVDGVELDDADGMGSFAVADDPGCVILVRNHESSSGGTTTLRYDCATGTVTEHRSLTQTRRNCAGGATPWGSWLSCEEDLTRAPRGRARGPAGRDHGYVYEVPALHDGRIVREPLVHLGRFNHEAAAVDPCTHIVYMTEDQIDGLFYRWLPARAERPLAKGGRLQALVFDDPAFGTDTRNWGRDDWAVGDWRDVRWATLNGLRGGTDDPRKRARKALNAVAFGCGEGIHFGDRELYFTCTSGGRIKSGQIMRYVPDPSDVGRGRLQLFLESTDPASFNYGDNLVVAPNGHLIVCEDPYLGGQKNYVLRDIAKRLGAAAPCFLRGVTPDGAVYDIARLRGGSELAGVCFSPDGGTLFLNVYSPARTLAIAGPWGTPRPGWSLYEARGPIDWETANVPPRPCHGSL
jgi:secreted PhoX family phosphatase